MNGWHSKAASSAHQDKREKEKRKKERKLIKGKGSMAQT